MRHAIQRARERYGVELTGEDLETMAASIEEGASEFVSAAERDREVHRVYSAKAQRFLNVVYAPPDGVIVTVLQDDCWQVQGLIDAIPSPNHALREALEAALGRRA